MSSQLNMNTIMKSPKVIIIGAGAAGIAATSRLLENGISDIIILEAENRIGGRINSVDFGGSVVDLGAQWCHGEKNNIVYNRVKELDLLGSSYNSYNDFTFYESTGKAMIKGVTDRLFQIALEIGYDDEALMKVEGSFGEYFTNRFNKQVKEEFGNNKEHLITASELLDWFHKLMICLDAAPTWLDLSAKGLLHYKQCEGDLYLHWKDRGFRTILYVLMKKFPDPANQLPVDDKIFFNKEVCKIVWNNNIINNGGVTVECLDGSSYNADHAIITLPLGVLKENYTSLFSPELPLNKQNAINGLGFGTVNKVLLEFPTQWWPNDCKGFNLLWAESDREDILNHFPHGPCKDGKSWLEDVFGFHTIDSHPRILLGWIVGPQAGLVELLPDDIILDGCMYLLRKFVGHKYGIPQPNDILRSAWHSNSHFSGSYSYRSIESEELNVTAKDLAEPIVVDSKQVLLFSGEATHSCYYSTVHGAIESGFREADRIINIYKAPTIVQTYKVVIVGAGMAGLGAAQTLIEAGCEDLLILEAQEEAGGRTITAPLKNGVVDIGAQWIHGTDNPLYKLANKHDLISPVISEEGQGIYIRDDGFIFDLDLVKKVDFEIGKILEQCENFVDSIVYPKSVGDFLEEKFLQHIKYSCDDNDVFQMKLELFDWHVRFQLIDNSCLNLKQLSAKEWGKYCCPGSIGQDHINLKNGYKSLVDTLVDKFPDRILKYNCPVSKINWKNSKNNVKISCSNDLIVYCDHVIVTASLGVLKHCASNLFEPSLPNILHETINSMGYYGGIGKIFLIFEYKWWNTNGFQLIWGRNANLTGVDSWTKDISGFDLVFEQPNVLLGWVGGKGVAVMEELSAEDVGIHCVQLLRRFLKNKEIPYPIKVIRSKFTSCPWIRGGYSHTTPQCDRLGLGPSNLCEPVFDKEIPRILLAGEACHSNHFSTTHGAFESGQKQAKVVLDFIQQ